VTTAPEGVTEVAPRGKPLWRSLLEILIAAGIVIVVLNALVTTLRVDSDDMSPALRPGQRVLVSRIPYLLTPPQRGDIIVVRNRIDPSKYEARRVIGVPGDQLNVQGVQVSLGGQPLREPYLPEGQDRLGVTPLATGQYQVPDNRYFVLNDNRTALTDSRSFGMVAPDEIVGRAWLVFWPLENISPVPHARLSLSE
jgi:signal peptidase I